MKLRVQKLHPEAILPKQMSTGAAGFDLTAVSIKELPNGTISYDTGLAFEIPKGYVGLLAPRSSIVKTSVRLGNSLGIIDSDYRGSISFVFDNIDKGGGIYGIGDRIGQMLIVPTANVELVESDELSNTDRGTGGYGSTGV